MLVVNGWASTGFHSEKLSQGAAVGELRAVAYCGSAIHFGEADITGFDITTRADKKNIKRVGGVHSLAAGRANEKSHLRLTLLSNW